MAVKRVYEGEPLQRVVVYLESSHIEAFKRYGERYLTDEQRTSGKHRDKYLGEVLREIMEKTYKGYEKRYFEFCRERNIKYVPPLTFMYGDAASHQQTTTTTKEDDK